MKKNLSGTHLEELAILASFHSTGKFYICYQKRKVVITLLPDVCSESYNNDLPGQIFPLIPVFWHECYGSNQHSFKCIKGTLHQMESTLDVVNWVKGL